MSRELSSDLVLVTPPGLKNSLIIIPFTLTCPQRPSHCVNTPYIGTKRGKGERENSVRTRERETIKIISKRGRYSMDKEIERREIEREIEIKR